jgi:hypothetical protein
VICGGESAPSRDRARAFDLSWAFDLLSLAAVYQVPFFMKQLGTNPRYLHKPFPVTHRAGADPKEWPADLRIRQMPAVFDRLVPRYPQRETNGLNLAK